HTATGSTLFPYTTLFRSLVQRNIPVTFVQPAASVINDTIEPAVEPRIMKAIPVHAPETRLRQGSSGQETTSSAPKPRTGSTPARSEEHTSELQSRFDLVC